MGKLIDLTGKTFNRLTVIERDTTKSKRTRWICKCSCGTETVVLGSDLKDQKVKSCGCLKKEIAVSSNTTHGDSKTRLYSIWLGIKKRCNNPKDSNYSKYGAVGITICNEWLDYISFKKWALANNYQKNLTIDRIDSTGDYEPSNCRWTDYSTQNHNQKLRSTNTSGYKGVSYIKHIDKYQAYGTKNGKRFNLGYYKTKEEAYAKRKEFESRYY
jgi:hypothetical protein